MRKNATKSTKKRSITTPFNRTAAQLSAIVILVAAIAASIIAFATPRTSSPYSKLDVFSRVLSYVERHHVESPDENKLIYGAIKGMMRTLDPHSSFLTPEEFEILKEDTHGNFQGVGMEVGIRDDVLTVISPIADSPAEEAGVEPGDQIVKIEGKPTGNMNIEEAVQLMRGPEGTEVTISVKRDGEKGFIEFTLKRSQIKVQSVTAELIVPGFARLWIKSFQDGTTAELKDAIRQMDLESGGLEGVVLDLRRNPGGLLEEAVRVSDLFLESGIILSTRGRGDAIVEQFVAKRPGTYTDIKVVVLIDGASASASEIVAGALQDSGRAMVVGTKSFGKGSVQSIIPLNHGCGLKLTIARYYTPSGKSIQGEGIEPDVLVESLNAPEPDELTQALQTAPDEAQLPGALASKQSTNEQGDQKDPEITDFQLRMAFHILRGLARSKATRQR